MRRPKRLDGKIDTITFSNKNQKVLFDEELSGQLSDGMWENTRPYDHWERPCAAKTEVGENIGLNFRTHKVNYNFASTELVDIIGSRMIAFVKASKVTKNKNHPFAFEYILDEEVKTLKQLKSLLNRKRWLREYIKESTFSQKMLDKFWAVDYTKKDLMIDLRGIKTIFRIRNDRG